MNYSRRSSGSEGRESAADEPRLVLDANILIRATLGKGARELIGRYATKVSLFAPDMAFIEANEYFPPLAAKFGLPLEQVTTVYRRLGTQVRALPEVDYREYESEARARIAQRDPDDWPVLACALLLDCPIWTEDRDFFGTGVATWTSDRVEIYFADTWRHAVVEGERSGGGSIEPLQHE